MNDSPGWASPGSAPSDGQKPGVPRPAEPADQNDGASKWSKAQPPAGQWSPPSAPGTGPRPPQQPGPAWGTGRGQGGGWGGPPPAAKPGVIPLRPLGVGEILDGAVSTLRAHWRTVLGITVTVAVITQVCDILIQRYLLPEPVRVDPNATPSEALNQSVDAMQSTMVSASPGLVITLIGTLFTTAVLTIVISRSVLGRPVTLSDAWRESKPQLPRLLGLTLLLPLMAIAIMTVGILPGALLGSAAGVGLSLLGGIAAFVVVLWLMIRFSLASPALMLERQSIMKSLSRSAKLVSGTWWRIFGILLLTMLLTFIVSMIIAVPFGLIAYAADDGLGQLFSGETPEFGWPFLIITGIGAVIATSITYPISAGVTVLLYVDQRIRREALDLELARAAGVPGYGLPADDTPGS
ncbi:glycerophosphoryl diester phosphodiesterase membrane domain-containing protein [Streptomyces spiramyceticus]|uniref:glycerophosphoryl diester phosphodiesterase membrane domain-containing protein n=1 Tax=Streptomyces spiramyceticus TaxID=299717 RepID=UPI00237AB4A5|nr:glycerophosphoryl diester phosphodiesterase membrane domain-containing protein [Streptomyces spiramyceticus]